MSCHSAVEHFEGVVMAGTAAVSTTGQGLYFAERGTAAGDHLMDGAFGHGIADTYVHEPQSTRMRIIVNSIWLVEVRFKGVGAMVITGVGVGCVACMMGGY